MWSSAYRMPRFAKLANSPKLKFWMSQLELEYHDPGQKCVHWMLHEMCCFLRRCLTLLRFCNGETLLTRVDEPRICWACLSALEDLRPWGIRFGSLWEGLIYILRFEIWLRICECFRLVSSIQIYHIGSPMTVPGQTLFHPGKWDETER